MRANSDRLIAGGVGHIFARKSGRPSRKPWSKLASFRGGGVGRGEATMTPIGSTAQMPDPQALEPRPAVARIAAFAAAARPEQLAPDVRLLLKRNIPDNLGCAIAALPGPPF